MVGDVRKPPTSGIEPSTAVFSVKWPGGPGYLSPFWLLEFGVLLVGVLTTITKPHLDSKSM